MEDLDLRAQAAHAAGLPAEFAARLRGDDLAALTDDAKTFAEALGAAAPSARFGSFDGGARRDHTPRTPTSLDEVRDLARRSPREFNRLVDEGRINLGELS